MIIHFLVNEIKMVNVIFKLYIKIGTRKNNEK